MSQHTTAHVAVIHTEHGLRVLIDGAAHEPGDLGLLRRVYELADEQRVIIRELGRAPAREQERLTQLARTNWSSLVRLLETMALDQRHPAQAVERVLVQLRADRDAARLALWEEDAERQLKTIRGVLDPTTCMSDRERLAAVREVLGCVS